mgnify:CR=1 FL=1
MAFWKNSGTEDIFAARIYQSGELADHTGIQFFPVLVDLQGVSEADFVALRQGFMRYLGIGAAKNGDTIYNGAADNASGTATILEIARAIKSLPVMPKRTMVFAAVTAEEQSLLGSEYYARFPLYPLDPSLLYVNFGFWDTVRTRDARPAGHLNRLIERQVDALGGILEEAVMEAIA